MLHIRSLALPAIVVASLTLAACAPSAPDAASSASPMPSAPAASSAPEPSPPETENPWQTVEAPDGATWSMPADWSTTDVTTENEVGAVLQIDVLDEEGAMALSYVHDLGGLGGIGGACTTSHPFEVLASTPSDAALTSIEDDAFSDAAYAIEQPAGGVVLTVGVIADSALSGERPNCLVYNVGYQPDGGMTSFATAFSSGVPAEPGDQGGGVWSFASFADAQAYVDSVEGQTMLEVVASLSLAG